MATVAETANIRQRDKLHKLTELGAVIALSASALGSSYAGYQAGLWDGDQAENYALAAAVQTEAANEKSLAMQRESMNAMHFTQWLNAYATGNAELEAFYRQRFRPAFRAAFDKWSQSHPRTNPKAPPTPFDVPGYREHATSSAARLFAEANGHYRAAERDNHVSDAYSRSVIIFALSLFLAGIVQGFDHHRTRSVLVALACLVSVLGFMSLIGLPAIRLF